MEFQWKAGREPFCVPQSIDYASNINNFDDIKKFQSIPQLDVPKIFAKCMEEDYGFYQDAIHLIPDGEPLEFRPNGGWKIRVAEPYLPEAAKKYVIDSLESGMISSASPAVERLSSILKEIFGVDVAQPCSSGFSSLLLAMQAANIGPGDDVIMPTLTMVAVGNSAHYVGARPIFADNCPENRYNPGWRQIEEVATDKVKAVVICHLYGVPCSDLDLIKVNCESRGWVLIEDISECVGIKDFNGRLLGTTGDFSVASLYVNKIVHGSDGGFVLAKDKRVAARLKSLTNHGFTENFRFVHFEHAINGKINGLGAALACGTLENLGKAIEHRSELAAIYREGLRQWDGIHYKTMPFCGCNDSPWVFGLEVIRHGNKDLAKVRAHNAWHRDKGLFFSSTSSTCICKKRNERDR